MAGLDHAQLRGYVIRPVLEHLGHADLALEELVLGTALQESRNVYLAQLNHGPAVGLWQMEPATHNDHWKNFLDYNHSLATKVRQLALPYFYDDALEMAGNLYYAAAMCAVHYLRRASIRVEAGDWPMYPLPAAGDLPGQARYWKRWYNTPAGAGTVQEYMANARQSNAFVT